MFKRRVCAAHSSGYDSRRGRKAQTGDDRSHWTQSPRQQHCATEFVARESKLCQLTILMMVETLCGSMKRDLDDERERQRGQSRNQMKPGRDDD